MDDNVSTLDEQLAEAYERGRRSVLDHLNRHEARMLLGNQNPKYLIVEGGRANYADRLINGQYAGGHASDVLGEGITGWVVGLPTKSPYDNAKVELIIEEVMRFTELSRFESYRVSAEELRMLAVHPSGIKSSRRGKNLKLSDSRQDRYTKSQKRNE